MEECNCKYGDRDCLDKIGTGGECPGSINDYCVSNIRTGGKPSELHERLSPSEVKPEGEDLDVSSMPMIPSR